MTPSEDDTIEEKELGHKASWELTERADSSAVSSESDDSVPTNYENTLPSYNDPASFEVQRTPGRLG
jgi:hypothetical protein